MHWLGRFQLLKGVLCLDGLLYVISGILAGGIPGFRIVLCCFTHSAVWRCVFCVFGFIFCVVFCRLMYLFIVFCKELLCVSIPFWLKDFHLCVYIFRFGLLSQQFSFGHL